MAKRAFRNSSLVSTSSCSNSNVLISILICFLIVCTIKKKKGKKTALKYKFLWKYLFLFDLLFQQFFAGVSRIMCIKRAFQSAFPRVYLNLTLQSIISLWVGYLREGKKYQWHNAMKQILIGKPKWMRKTNFESSERKVFPFCLCKF